MRLINKIFLKVFGNTKFTKLPPKSIIVNFKNAINANMQVIDLSRLGSYSFISAKNSVDHKDPHFGQHEVFISYCNDLELESSKKSILLARFETAKEAQDAVDELQSKCYFRSETILLSIAKIFLIFLLSVIIIDYAYIQGKRVFAGSQASYQSQQNAVLASEVEQKIKQIDNILQNAPQPGQVANTNNSPPAASGQIQFPDVGSPVAQSVIQEIAK